MTIRKLEKSIDPSERFFIFKDEAIIIFESSSDEHVFFIKSPNSVEILSIFNEFSGLENIRYVGCKNIYNKINSFDSSLPNFIKRYFTDDESVNVYFVSETGKVKVEFKSQPNIIEKNKKNVLVVDDSVSIQKILQKIIDKSDVLQVQNIASSAKEAKEMIEKSRPDLITLDLHMGEVSGVDFLRDYLIHKDIPVVIISSISISEGPIVMEALSLGAKTYIQKPSLENLNEFEKEINSKLEVLVNSKNISESFPVTQAKKSFLRTDRGLIAIGSSTGGTQALEKIFKQLPDEIPPIVVVQHIPADFSRALADRLNSLCKFLVKEAKHGDEVSSNTIYIAPGGMQMRVVQVANSYQIQVLDEPEVNRFKPSVDYLFNSLVNLGEKRLLGVILTGMGKDGASGLLAIKNSGGYTIAQDENSSVVFGMPKEAINIGAVDEIVSLNDMGNSIVIKFNSMFKQK